jgi:hypothetical protein
MKEEEIEVETPKPGTPEETALGETTPTTTPTITTTSTPITPAAAAAATTPLQAGFTVSLQGPPAPIIVGNEFPAVLSIEGKEDIKIIKIQWAVDPAVVGVKEISEGAWLKEKDTGIHLFKTFDNQKGKIIINITMDAAPGEGRKELAVIHFRALSAGSISLESPAVFEVLDSNLKKTGAAFSGATVRIVK